MELVVIFLIVSVIINFALAWGFWNSTKLISRYEDLIMEMKVRLDETYEQLKTVDIDGAFEADDEVGFVFSYIYEMIRELNETFNPEKEYEQQKKKQEEKKGLERLS